MLANPNAIIMTVEGVRTRASTNEALVTFAVPLENADLVSGFMAKIGRQVGAAFADVERQPGTPNSDKPKVAAHYGDAAAALKKSGFCRNPKVWQALGSDEEFRHWIQRQPSAWSGLFSEYLENGEGRCEAAHVSRIEFGRGIGHKPDYACIPLTHQEHMAHHERGESVFDDGYISTDGPKKVSSGREWMERMRWKYVERWAWEKLRSVFGCESMRDVPPPALRDWARKFNVEQYLPPEYRDET